MGGGSNQIHELQPESCMEIVRYSRQIFRRHQYNENCAGLHARRQDIKGDAMSKKVLLSLVALSLIALTGCGSNSKTNPTTTPTPSSSPTVSATPASLVCDSSQLVIQLGVEDAAMGSRGVTGMTFQNTSAKSCTLEGYPIVQMIDANGKSLPTYVTHFGSFNAPKSPTTLVTLAPGAKAKFDLLYEAQTGYGNAVCPTSSKVDFTPPGSTVALPMDLKIQPYGGGTIQKLRCGEIKVSPVYFP